MSILTALLFGISNGCSVVDTTNPQNSESISDAKKRGVFLQELHLKHSSVDSFALLQAWVERGSYNEVDKFGKVITTHEDWSQIVFVIDEKRSAAMFSSRDLLLKWYFMEETDVNSVSMIIHKSRNKMTIEYVYIPQNRKFDNSKDVKFDIIIQHDDGTKITKQKLGYIVIGP